MKFVLTGRILGNLCGISTVTFFAIFRPEDRVNRDEHCRNHDECLQVACFVRRIKPQFNEIKRTGQRH